MEETDFSELGLTKNELKVYHMIIQHGKLSAGDASKFSGVSYSRIYDVLASLEQKGFIKIVPEKTKKFTSTDPTSLIEIIDKKEENLKKLKEEVKKMKEFYDIKEKNPVIVGYGKNAFYKIVKEIKEPNKNSYTIKWSSEYRPEWERKHRENIKKGVDSKTLARYDKETDSNIRKWLELGRKIKKFKNEGVALEIVDEDEVMIGLIKSNSTLLIKDKPFAKIMKQLFLDSYKNAEEIK